MRPNSGQLAMRDPAMAALMGTLPGSDFGQEFGSDFGRAHPFAGEYDEDNFDFGLEAPPPPPMMSNMPVHVPRHPAFHPNNQHYIMEMWDAEQHRTGRRMAREILLDPNAGSSTKVERYSFSLSFPLVLGTPAGIVTTQSPETTIRGQRVIMNAPGPGFVLVSDLKVANLSVIIGDVEDAWVYNANGVGVMLDLPTLEPSNRASFFGTYSGFTPPGYTITMPYTFTVTLQGPSTMAG
jgi:hypothetical protein